MSSTNAFIIALNSEPHTNQRNFNEIENSNQAIIPYFPSINGHNHLNQPIVLNKDETVSQASRRFFILTIHLKAKKF